MPDTTERDALPELPEPLWTIRPNPDGEGTVRCTCLAYPHTTDCGKVFGPGHMRAYAEQARSRPSAPEGWVMVPREPTTEMLTAGSKAVDLHSHSPAAVWFAMLAAAPKE